MKNSLSPATVYFVYIGKKLPTYAVASLELAGLTSGAQLHLIANKSIKRGSIPDTVGFTAIEDFYDIKKFESAKSNLISNPSFRNGFWVKSLERFFVLEQFASSNGLNSLVHAELDQILFSTDKLVSAINQTGRKGLFIPFHSPQAAVASIVYINELSALTSLNDFSGKCEPFNNEMELLARWAKSNPEMVFGLPTLATELKGAAQIAPPGVMILSTEEIGGLVDAAQLGQWFGGIDPRNVPIRERPTTKFVDPPKSYLLNRADFQGLDFRLSRNQQELSVNFHDRNCQIFNLHIHSKIHNLLLNKGHALPDLVLNRNHPEKRIESAMRRTQILTYLYKLLTVLKNDPNRVRAQIIAGCKRHFNQRPSSYPLVSGDTFRKIAHYVWEAESRLINPGDIKAGDIIFCESELYEDLYSKVLSNTSASVVVLLGNSDRNQSRIECVETSPRTPISFFAQNIIDEIENLRVLPIGIENAWHSKNGMIKMRNVTNSLPENKTSRVMWAFSIGTNPIERAKAAKALSKNPNSDQLMNLSPKQHQKALNRYAFVASPPGNGLDTHRTWEAFYFKCVPIVLKSFMTTYYQDIGLPIWVVDSYEELLKFDESDLKIKYDDFKSRFGSEAIWANYWIKDIEAESKKLRDEHTPK